MRLTHFGHACVLAEFGSTRILVDPGAFSSGFESEHVDAILITHRHFDHFNPEMVFTLLAANPAAQLWLEATTELAPGLIDPSRVNMVKAGDVFEIGSTTVRAVGGTHACIHSDIELIPNVGYYFPDEQFLHPGDEFIELDEYVRVLAAPISGPWQSLEDVIDYVRDVRPDIVVPIHEAILSRPKIYTDYLERLKPAKTRLVLAAPGVAETL